MKIRICKFIILLAFTAPLITAQQQFIGTNSTPGAFSRMGFGPRGVAMGNALSAVTEGNLVSYYNPALSGFQEGNSVNIGYTLLNLDRSLNFLSFTRKFDFFSSKDSANPDRKPRTTAGVSIGILNSGVSNIDGRDNQGYKTGELSTSENQVFLSVSNKFSEKFSVGISAKLYYYKLYEKISTTGIGLDIGILYSYNAALRFAFVITDVNSKYKWDTAPIYETDGMSTVDEFPVFKKIGVSYYFRKYDLLLAGEYIFDNAGSKIVRLGAEYMIYDNLYLRGGLDNGQLSAIDETIRPSLGFSFSKHIDNNISIGIEYAFQIEPFSRGARHLVGMNVIF